ncbi:MAG: hypothetical protein HYR96_05570 [Deltaproteobacteria bacterium]|nr:hypothetical protein [Deltaproteobacteria bacterium]
MNRFHFSSIGFLFVALLLGCNNPEQTYFNEIKKAGFIPFTHPMSGVGTGMIVRGTPDQLMPMAPPSRCFPYLSESMPNDLRWESDADLPSTHYTARVDFNASLNTIAAAGTPGLTFKFNMTNIHKVDFEANGVTAEMFDQMALQDHINSSLSQQCKDAVMQYPFVLNALKAKEMSFIFFDSWGGRVQLTADNLKQIVDIGADITWKIENDFKLIITSPKYIGYHLAQLRPEDNGLVHLIATQLDPQGKFLFIEYAE